MSSEFNMSSEYRIQSNPGRALDGRPRHHLRIKRDTPYDQRVGIVSGVFGVPETSIREILGAADVYLRVGVEHLDSVERERLSGRRHPWGALEKELEALGVSDSHAAGLVRSFVRGIATELSGEGDIESDGYNREWARLVRLLQTPLSLP